MTEELMNTDDFYTDFMNNAEEDRVGYLRNYIFSLDKEELLEDNEICELCVINNCENILIMRAEQLKCKTQINSKLKAIRHQIQYEKNQEKAAQEEEKMLEKAKASGLECFAELKGLPPYIERHENKEGGVYYTVNCPQLAKFIQENCSFKIIKDKNAKENRVFWYDKGIYSQLNEEEFNGALIPFINAFDENILKMRDIKETKQILKSVIDGEKDEVFNTDENIINFQNGLLYLDIMELKPHTPDVLSTIQLPCDYDPTATQCPVFDEYLDRLCESREDYKRLLLQFCGAVISNVHAESAKRLLFIYGPHDSGKSKILELLKKIIGKDNCASLELKILEENQFATIDLYNKRLGYCGDLKSLNISQMNTIKQITGGDSIRGEFKGGNIISFTFHGMLGFGMNELPKFGGDVDPNVYKRFMILDVNHAIAPNEQITKIDEKMFAERQAVINRILPHLKKFIENGGRFDEPEQFEFNRLMYMDENSPVRQFFKECCVTRESRFVQPDDQSTTRAIHLAFKSWLADNYRGKKRYTLKDFKREILWLCQKKLIQEITIRTSVNSYYVFELTREALNEYSRGFTYTE